MGDYCQGERSGAITPGMFGGISHGFHFMEMKNLEDEKVGNIISMDFLRGVGRWGVSPLLSANERRKMSEFNECHETKRNEAEPNVDNRVG
jgi:hypothetical protein